MSPDLPWSGIDWEDAFSNAAYIERGEAYPQRWAERAAAFRASASADLGVRYGGHPRERMDLFFPGSAPRGLAVFVHGGYWLAFDSSSWSDLARGAVELGWAVAIPSYGLAPDFRIGQITRQVAAAVSAAAGRVAGPIRLAGHSAGGHLVSRMMCADAAPPVADRIERVVSISGLHDLRPLRLHSMNARLRLDDAEAATESPALAEPISRPKFLAWVGGAERPEFLRQSALVAEAWSRKGSDATLVVEERRHHFDVIDGLRDPAHPLTRAFAGP